MRTEKTDASKAAEPKVHKALSHELRIRIHNYLIDHPTGTPAEMAKTLDAPLGDVSHHVKQLVKYGMAEFVEERKGKRGMPEHVYRSISRLEVTTEDLNVMDGSTQQGFFGEFAKTVVRDLRGGIESGSIAKRNDWTLANFPMMLDAEGWEEMRALHQHLYDETAEVEVRSANRIAESGEAPIKVSSTQMCFELP